MKKYLLLSFMIIIGFFLPITDYVELNHLMIVKDIGLDCKDNIYHLYMKEIIPKKEDNGIQYDYQIYQGEGATILKAYQDLSNHTNKKIFFKNTKSIITNCTNTKDLIKTFTIKPKWIIHTKKSIKKELRNP